MTIQTLQEQLSSEQPPEGSSETSRLTLLRIALSRLYSPLPHLYCPAMILPSTASPLSSAFTSTTGNLESLHRNTAKSVHLATPRLLLSLLATTIYLGQTPLMREVSTMILRTISAATIGRYLRFAMGQGIGLEEWDGQDNAAARGFEDVAQTVNVPLKDVDDRSSHDSIRSIDTSTTSTSTHTADTSLGHINTASHCYGIPSDKIGEACASWLCRWAVETFDAEVQLAHDTTSRVWRQRGLPARFVRSILSSDLLFIKGEMDRYRLARSILDLRRAGWDSEMDDTGDSASTVSSSGGHQEWEDDETEMDDLFASGIYYTHMVSVPTINSADWHVELCRPIRYRRRHRSKHFTAVRSTRSPSIRPLVSCEPPIPHPRSVTR